MTAAAGTDPILTSKIVVPDAPGWLVPRPRLDKLIARGARGPITTVTGPPGAGKTMALALWAASNPGGNSIAWVTVDDYDNRPGVFWSYALAAFRQAGVSIPKTLSTTARRYVIDHEFLLRLASVMAAQDPPVTLVLDDVHLLTGAEVLAGLGYVLKHARPGLGLVLSSRMDPLLSLHPYRLTGDLTEIRASDLAFTVDESRLLLAQHGITLSEGWLERLTRRAEGWAAVMRMAAISMGGHSDPEKFAKELVAEDGAVTGYLVEEVLNTQPAYVRDFLLSTSILDRVSGEIASELSGSTGGGAVLVDLARANPLIQRDDAGWYRYHSLFAAVLRLKLRRDNPERVTDLHLRAARWYRRNGDLTEAVRHAANAGDWQFASRTIVDELVLYRLLEPRGNEPLVAGFRRMPDNRDWAEPQSLLVAAATDLARSPDSTGAPYLGAAESMLERLPAGKQIPSRLAASLSRLATSRRTGDLEAATGAAERALNLIEAIGDDQLARHPEVRTRVLCGSAAVKLWSGQFDEATAIFESAAGGARAPERELCLGYLALMEAAGGRLNHAAELAVEATASPEDDRSRPARQASRAAEVALAFVHVERNELPRGQLWLKHANDALRTRPDKLLGAMACYVAARDCLAAGRGQAALEIIGRAGQGWSPPPWLEQRLMVLRSRAFVATGDLPSAIDDAVRAGAGSSLDAAAALARALLAAGDPRAARNALTSVSPDAQAFNRLAAWLTDAQVSYANNDATGGRRALEHALRLAEPERFLLPLVLERAWIRPALRREPELAQRYRRLLEPDVLSPAWLRAWQPRPVPPVIEPLSEREREVLRYVSTMESNAEIATEMYISVNTVKTHLKSIYRKLAASHRGEAVRRAKECGLL